MNRNRCPALAYFYATLIEPLKEIAQAHGYALAVHGSMTTDLDLIAVPWTPEASDALTLIKAMKEAIGACTHHFELDHHWPDCNPTPKPHGRIAYSLHLTNRGGEGPYLDVSVMPRQPASVPDIAAL